MQFYSSENPELITKIIIFFKLLRFTYQLYLKIKYKGIKILTFCAVFLPLLALALQLPALFPAARTAFTYILTTLFSVHLLIKFANTTLGKECTVWRSRK